jgi:hypothetical protein
MARSPRRDDTSTGRHLDGTTPRRHDHLGGTAPRPYDTPTGRHLDGTTPRRDDTSTVRHPDGTTSAERHLDRTTTSTARPQRNGTSTARPPRQNGTSTAWRLHRIVLSNGMDPVELWWPQPRSCRPYRSRGQLRADLHDDIVLGDGAQHSRALRLYERRGSGERENSMWMVMTGHAQLPTSLGGVPAHTTHIADTRASAPIGFIF